MAGSGLTKNKTGKPPTIGKIRKNYFSKRKSPRSILRVREGQIIVDDPGRRGLSVKGNFKSDLLRGNLEWHESQNRKILRFMDRPKQIKTERQKRIREISLPAIKSNAKHIHEIKGILRKGRLPVRENVYSFIKTPSGDTNKLYKML